MLVMLPYPSGRIHMGHVRNYTLGDMAARFRRMRGAVVCQPLGWDAFGLPAENAAIQHGTHPAAWTRQNIADMKAQIQRLGISYDWGREIATCGADYYTWNQWLFIQMWRRGDVFRAERNVNWCEALGTVLANEQVVDGKYERTGDAVVQKPMEQYFLRITKYAEELLNDLDGLDWPENVKAMQRHWIGRSEGAKIRFDVVGRREPERAAASEGPGDPGGVRGGKPGGAAEPEGSPPGRASSGRQEPERAAANRACMAPHMTGEGHGGTGGSEMPPPRAEQIEVFTTRLDTLFGVSFMALSTEHPLVLEAAKMDAGLREFCERISATSREERLAGDAKEGHPTAIRARHPFTGAEIPVYAANYVLMDYGAGAVMGVPAHDVRDFEFAKKYGLPIIKVVKTENAGDPCQKGTLANSGEFDGMTSDDAARAMLDRLGGRAEAAVTYRLKDWGLSRQRYWGTPIPTVHCPRHGVVPEMASRLPVRLPEDAAFTGTGPSPLATSAAFTRARCPICDGPARRETDTMDTFVDSSWYFLRYLDPRNQGLPFSRREADAWMPVDLYIGGIEHATAHLVYARYFHKVLRDLGLVGCGEPFKKLICQGMVLKDGSKMSKSKGNVVDPDEVVNRFGADALRVFMAFAAPIEKEIDWTGFEGIEGATRFLKRAARLVDEYAERYGRREPEGTAANRARTTPHPTSDDPGGGSPKKEDMTPEELRLAHRLNTAIKRITDDLETRHQFNTVVSSLMELANDISDLPKDAPHHREMMGGALSAFARMLSPVAPHLAEQLWEQLGGACYPGPHGAGYPGPLGTGYPGPWGTGFCMHAAWPDYDAAWLETDEHLVVVQVNGKVRGRVTVDARATEDERREAALACPEAQPHLVGREILKVIVPPGGRLVSVVAKGGPAPMMAPERADPKNAALERMTPEKPLSLDKPAEGGEMAQRGKRKKK
jgi:leucyl-tRNA synthetase